MRLLIVSNRLPVQLPLKEKKESIGGLVTGIAAFVREIDNKNTIFNDYVWVGWPGVHVQQKEQAATKKVLLEKRNCCPVYLDPGITEGFYNNYCNRVLWPLFHYFPEYVENNNNDWVHYKEANYNFFEVLSKEIKEDDFVWIHDYHLMLLPALLRSAFPKLKISFFLHIPFPAFDMLRQLPNREQDELLRGLLGADLIGVHTIGYKKHLLETYAKVLAIESNQDSISKDNREIKIGVFPMGIHYQDIFKLAVSEKCMDQKKAFRKKFPGKKIMVSIDRLDYTKGIANRLLAFYNLLKNFPKWKNKVSLLLIVAPSRREINTYIKIKNEIDQLVGRINGEFGNTFWVPVVYQYQQFNLTELCVLYGACDIFLVTPLRDGMNLVAKEFITANDSKNGVLILSEFAGAALELSDAIIVNPHSHKDLTEAMYTALTITEDEKYRKNEIMRRKVEENNVVKWAGDIIKTTVEIAVNNNKTAASCLTDNIQTEIANSYKTSAKCLLFLDYDGTLSPFSAQPHLHWPEASTIQLLQKIANNDNDKTVILSGRTKSELSKWFENVDLDIGAEFGSWLKSGNKWSLNGTVSDKWKKSIRQLIIKYADMVPQSFLEEKEYALIWDHRKAEANTKSELINSFLEDISKNPFYSDGEISFLNGQNTFIIRCKGFDKGSAAKYWLEMDKYDFILAIGDDDADEELFKALPDYAISLKVGTGETAAKYYTANQKEVINLINMLN